MQKRGQAPFLHLRVRCLVLFAFSGEKVDAPGEPFVELRGRNVIDRRSPPEAAHVKVDGVLFKPRLIALVCR